MVALSTWNGGVIVISHDERFITSVAKDVRGLLLSRICHSDAPLNTALGVR
jgi:ATP-binding cassette subfamily F protein 3